MTTKLSEHFTLEEFLISQTATRLGIDNMPMPEHLKNLGMVASHLETVRDHFDAPIIVSSGYRSPALNAAVPGSSSTSAHPQGLATDFHVIGVSNIEVCLWIHDNMIVDQVIYEFGPFPKGWVHMGLSLGTPRRQALTAYKSVDNKTAYRLGIVEMWSEAQ